MTAYFSVNYMLDVEQIYIQSQNWRLWRKVIIADYTWVAELMN